MIAFDVFLDEFRENNVKFHTFLTTLKNTFFFYIEQKMRVTILI